MTTRLSNRLGSLRHSRFVGRALEQKLFQSALAEDELPVHVLYIFGPGGVGKSSLLHMYAYLCEQAGTPYIQLDARNVEPSPEAFLQALQSALGVSPQVSPFAAIAEKDCHFVILIDTYEALAPVDEWIHGKLIDELPENALLITAGRQPPSIVWRPDPAWQTLIRAVPLRNLSPQESRDFLARRDIAADQFPAVLDFTHGHPLALSLVADLFAQRENYQFRPEDAPDVIKLLLEKFVQKVPGPAHRAALELCACARSTTESLLAEVLRIPDAHDLFDWLRGLSFIEQGQFGLFPHDLAREALVADIRWRNPDWYAELHQRTRTYYANRLPVTAGAEQQRVIYDYVYLHRDNPVLRPYFEWQGSGLTLLADILRPGDEPVLAELVRRFEGEEAERWFHFWLERHPQGLMVFRQSRSRPAGLLFKVRLDQAQPADLLADPGTRAAWEFLAQKAALRPGEGATLFRFWLTSESYQDVSAVQSLIFINMVLHYLVTPGLAYTLLPCADPDFWTPVFAYADLARLPAADFTCDGRHFGVYGHDWRVMPPVAWLALLAERELAFNPPIEALPPTAETLVILSQSEFEAAIRGALRDYHRPAMLAGSPLLRSRLVIEQAGAQSGTAQRAAALQAILKSAAESLQATPRETRLYRVLYHTYFQPALTQEQAAEILDLPFSTYRRQLKAGIQRVADILWQKEIGGLEK